MKRTILGKGVTKDEPAVWSLENPNIIRRRKESKNDGAA